MSILEYNKNIDFLSYDLRSENIKNLNQKEKEKVATLRVKIWYKIRYYYRLRAINYSMYEIPNNVNINELKADIEKWKNEYNNLGLKPIINIISLKTTEEGYKTFKEMERAFLMEWLGDILENLDKIEKKKGKISKRNLNQYNKRLDLINHIVNEDFKNDNELNDLLFMVYDSLNNLKINGV
jgi:hypothetical protein